MRLRVQILLALLGSCLLVSSASAWPHSPLTDGLDIGNGTSSPSAPVPDGLGGCFVPFTHYSGGYDLYIQHYDAAGNALWGANGLPVSTGVGDQYDAVIVRDSQGGCFLAWFDTRTTATTGNDVYAQHLSAAGVPLWTANGVALCTATGPQYILDIADDNQGGAWFAWNDYRGAGGAYIQHVNSLGSITATANGLPVTALSSSQNAPSLACDVYGYACVAWVDYRVPSGDIYAQRFSPSGVEQWTAGGAVVCSAVGTQYEPQLALLGDGSPLIAWTDIRGADSDIYAQKLSASSGAAQWAANGVPVCSATGAQSGTRLTVDASGYAVVLWQDLRTSNTNLYAQRIDATGVMQWSANGIAVRSAPGSTYYTSIASDGLGGTLIAWSDSRTDLSDVYAQRLNASGYALWSSGGVLVAGGTSSQYASGVCPSAAGGAYVTFVDGRTVTPRIQAVDEWGFLGAEPVMAGVKDIPNDQGGQVKVSWYASPLDTDPVFRSVTDYVIYRSVPTSLAARLARVAVGDAATLEGRTYRRVRYAATDYFWEELAHVTPRHLSAYSYVAATEGDSVAGSNPPTVFMVMALGNYGSSFWTSAPDSGFSVDNLAPAPPGPLTGQFAPGHTALHWNPNVEPDLAGYRVYRGLAPGFAIGASSLVASVPDTGYADPAAAPYYYKLTSVDVHGNESSPTLLQPSGTAGVGDAALRTAFAAPAPNPVRGGASMSLHFTLAAPGNARLALYDAQGRLAAVLCDGPRAAGEHTVRLDARDGASRALAPGLYLARLTAPGFAATRRIVVVE